MTVTLSPPMFLQFFNPNNSGASASGFKLFTYVAGTSTKQATWTDSTQSVQNANPLILDSGGGGYIWGDPTLLYKFVWALPNDTDPPTGPIRTVDNISFPLSLAALTQQVLGGLLYPQTTAEAGAGIVPTYDWYAPDPIADIRRYGWSASNTAAQNVTALRDAIAVRTAAGGGIVQLPAGSFAITDSIVIPENITVRGVGGTHGTTLTSTSTGNPAFLLGGTISGVLKYGCSLTDVQIVLSNGNGKAIQLMECVQGVVRNVYIQGPISAGRSTKGVVIDGGNIGCFFNLIENVECSHIHIGFDQLSTGSTEPTMQIFINISGNGDFSNSSHPDTTSIGYRFQGSANTGNGTVVSGSDFEDFKYGSYFTSGCGGSTTVGFRGEGNSIDILCETSSGAQVFLGGICDIASGKILVNTSVPLNTINGSGIPHRFWGMVNGSNGPNNGYWSGTNYFYGSTTGDAPVTVVAFPGDTTVPIFDLQNSSGNHLFQISAQGRFLRVANASPATVTGAKAGNLALASLITTLANYGLIVDGTT